MNTATRYFAIFAIAATLLGSTGCLVGSERHGDRDRGERRVDVGVDVREHRDDGDRKEVRHEERHEESQEEYR
jgi:hypothetical protein